MDREPAGHTAAVFRKGGGGMEGWGRCVSLFIDSILWGGFKGYREGKFLEIKIFQDF